MDLKKRQWIKKAKKGDGEAFVKIIKEYETVLYGTAIRILKHEEDVQDALQNTILKAFEKMMTLKQDQYFNTWLHRILMNECYKIIEVRKKDLQIIDFDVS